MPFVTRITFKSGDGNRLDDVVQEVTEQAQRKGVELRGPHAAPPDTYHVPQYKVVGRQDCFESWVYTVYTRVIEIVEHNEFAREVTEREYPDLLRVTVDVETI